MKIGDGVFYVLNEGPKKGQVRPAVVTNVSESQEDFQTGEKFDNGQPKWGVRKCVIVDLCFFASQRDGFTRPVEWRTDVKVDKKDDAGKPLVGSCYAMGADSKADVKQPAQQQAPRSEGSGAPQTGPGEVSAPKESAVTTEQPKAAARVSVKADGAKADGAKAKTANK